MKPNEPRRVNIYGYGKSRNVKIDLTFIIAYDISTGEYVS